MLYFGEVLKGMRESDKDHRAKRAENARLYNNFRQMNPDATVEEREKYAKELGENNPYLRSALPDRSLMEQTVARRQTELEDEKRNRDLQIVRANAETQDLALDQLSSIAIGEEDTNAAIQNFISNNPWASENPFISNGFKDGSLTAVVNSRALNKSLELMKPQIDQWIQSGAKMDAVPNVLKNTQSNNAFVNEALTSHLTSIAENRKRQDVEAFLSRVRQMPDQLKRSSPEEFSQNVDAALQQAGLTRDDLEPGVLDGLAADHKDRATEYNINYNRRTNDYKQRQLESAIKQAQALGLTDPDAFAEAVQRTFDQQTADEGTGVELNAGDIETIKRIHEANRNEQIRTEINSGISTMTESDFVRQVRSESFPQFDPDQRKDVIVAMGSAIQAQLADQLMEADSKGAQNLITGAYAERIFSMTNRVLSELGLPVGDGSIHQAVASSLALKDPDGEFSLESIKMTDIARAIDARMRSSGSYQFAVNASANGDLASLIVNNSPSAQSIFDRDAALEFRSFYETVEADRRMKASNPYDVDRNGDGRSDFYSASAEEAIQIPLVATKEISDAVSGTNRSAVEQITAQYQSTGQLTDEIKESAVREALSLRKALSGYQAQMITLRKLQSPTTQEYYRMDDRHLMQIRSQLTLIEEESKVARDLLRQVEQILMGQ